MRALGCVGVISCVALSTCTPVPEPRSGTDGGMGGVAQAGNAGAMSPSEGGAAGDLTPGPAGGSEGGAAGVSSRDGTSGDAGDGAGGGGGASGNGGASGESQVAGWAGDTGAAGSGSPPVPIENCPTQPFQFVKFPPGWRLSGAGGVGGDGLVLSGNGCVLTGSIQLGDGGTYSSFRWTESSGLQILSLPDGVFAVPSAITDDGSKVFGRIYSKGTAFSVFVWTRETGFVSSPPPGDSDGFVTCASGDGSAVSGTRGTAGGYYAKDGSTEDLRPLLPAPVPVTPSYSFIPYAMTRDGSKLVGLSSPDGVDTTIVTWTHEQGTQSTGVKTEWGTPISISSDGRYVLLDRWALDLAKPATPFGNRFIGLPGEVDAGAFKVKSATALAMSDDAKMIVGRVEVSDPYHPFQAYLGPLSWPFPGKGILISTILAEHGIGLDGEHLLSASEVSRDGRTVAGNTEVGGLWIATAAGLE